MMPRLILLLAAVLTVPSTLAQGRGMGRGMGGDGSHMDAIHALLADHESIERHVVDRSDGVETWTESDDPEVAARIREHVRQMDARLEDGRPIRRWDPLFAEIFEHADAITMEIEDTERGVRVVETSDDPYVVRLIQQHAHRAVSEFVERGMDRAHEPTPLPSPPTTSAMPTLPAFDDARFTSTKLYEGGTRVTGFALRAGQGLPEHSVADEAFLLVTEGAARVAVGGAVHTLGAGDGVVLPGGVPHALDATEDTRIVLVRAR
jgi:quercetin dioxygenase-like cupin family protein